MGFVSDGGVGFVEWGLTCGEMTFTCNFLYRGDPL